MQCLIQCYDFARSLLKQISYIIHVTLCTDSEMFFHLSSRYSSLLENMITRFCKNLWSLKLGNWKRWKFTPSIF